MDKTEQIPPIKRYPNLKQSFGLLGIFILIQIIVSIIFLFLGMLLFDSSSDSSIVFFIVYILSFVLTLWFAVHKRRPFSDSVNFYFSKIPAISYPILILITLSVLILLDPLIGLIPMPDFFKQLLEEMMSSKNPWVIILMVIGAPILEEMLFRGIILDGFLHHYSPKKAIIWSSILFGLIHLNPWQFVAAFLGGLLLGWVYWQTRSLLPAIFIHFIMNFSSFLIQFIWVGDEQMFLTFESLGDVWIFIFLMVVSIVILKFGLPILKQIFSPISKTDEFTRSKPPVPLSQKPEPTEETEEARKARKRKGCLRILLIVMGAILLSAMVCTFGIKLLLKDSLAENVKQEIIQLVENDEQLKGKFSLSNVTGNKFYLKADLEFFEKSKSIEDVKHWTQYVCDKCKEVLKRQHINSSSINITAKEKISDSEIFIFGVMSYNSFSNSYNFLEMNKVR